MAIFGHFLLIEQRKSAKITLKNDQNPLPAVEKKVKKNPKKWPKIGQKWPKIGVFRPRTPPKMAIFGKTYHRDLIFRFSAGIREFSKGE